MIKVKKEMTMGLHMCTLNALRKIIYILTTKKNIKKYLNSCMFTAHKHVDRFIFSN